MFNSVKLAKISKSEGWESMRHLKHCCWKVNGYKHCGEQYRTTLQN